MANNTLYAVRYPGSSGTRYELDADTDTTLTEPGVAADAKKTGDEITSIKNRVTTIENAEPPDPPALDGVYPLAATVNNGHPSVGWSADLGFRVVDGLINITWEE